MDEPCDICGHIGRVPELSISCSKCRICREHIYCMRVCPDMIPDNWICESCLVVEKVIQKSGDIGLSNWQGKLSKSRRQKNVPTGKVKFIPSDEVIKLTSEAAMSGLPFKSKTKVAQRTSAGIKTPPAVHTSSTKAICSVEHVKKTPPAVYTSSTKAIRSVEHVKASKDTSERLKATTMQQHSIPSISCEGSASARMKAPTLQKHRNGVSSESSPKVIKNIGRKPPYQASSSKKYSPVFSSGGTGHANSDNEDRDLVDVLSKIHLYRPFFPALPVAWKGGFVVLDTVSTGEFYGGFQAQPPCRVSHKTYEFSKTLPSVLQVELLPESRFEADLFLDHSLNLHDIALYFTPSDCIERSKQKKSSLLDHMEENHSSIMRSYFNGVELLIFTSKHLHYESHKIITKSLGNVLLLGIFRPAKNDEVKSRECKAMVPLSGCAQICEKKAEIEASNIQMDKKQAKNSLISRLDAAIEELKFGFKLQNQKERDAFPLVATKIKEETDNEVPPLKSSFKTSSNSVDEMDCPPGFKKNQA